MSACGRMSAIVERADARRRRRRLASGENELRGRKRGNDGAREDARESRRGRRNAGNGRFGRGRAGKGDRRR